MHILTVADLQTGGVLFTEPGIDGYWSPDGTHLIFKSLRPEHGVSILDVRSGRVYRRVAPSDLGDYFSWGYRDGRHTILTIYGHYYFLDHQFRAILPASTVPFCPPRGIGERPLLSRDGRRITTFISGRVVVRNLTDCEDIVETNLVGAKADLSPDNRHLAFHTPKKDGNGYEIAVVDIQQRTVTRLQNLSGSSFFPSWTDDGRLCFRYAGADFRGFLLAGNVLTQAGELLPTGGDESVTTTSLYDILSPGESPPHDLAILLMWSQWCVHCPFAFDSLSKLSDDVERLRRRGIRLVLLTADDGVSYSPDGLDTNRKRSRVVPVQVARSKLGITGALNQLPALLLFRRGTLVARHLGELSYADLRRWIDSEDDEIVRARHIDRHRPED